MRQTNKIVAEAVLANIKRGQPIKKVAASLAAWLIDERRTKDADAIIREVERQLVAAGSVELRVTTVHGLSDKLRSEISGLFKDKASRVTINEIKDPSVLGGVLVESNEDRLDLTVRRQLQRLKGVKV